MPIVGYDSRADARIQKPVREQIDLVVALNPDKYLNRAHFIRVAVIRLLREELKE